MKKILPLLFFTVLIISCEQDISVDLPDPEKKIVVDGGIFTGEPAAVTLTWSAGYFDPLDSASLANYVISSALVTVWDGTTLDTLQFTVDFNRPIPFVFRGSNVIGQTGRTYVLTVVADGKTATSTTTIPPATSLDSIWFKPYEVGDSLGFIYAHLTEPAGEGNGYRWFAKRIGKDPEFLAPFGSAFDDKFVDGESFDFAYNRPDSPGSTAPEDNGREAGFYKIGDTVAVKFCSIGSAEVAFFRTFEIELSNNGNPFAAPGVIESNVQGGLGIFCGYNPTYDTVICQ